jgi:leader peptidase (prepilin peptidase)/N-methyltransferase
MLAAAGVLWGVGWLGAKAFRREAMGFGDVKMFGAMGAVLGMWVFLALVVASLTGALIGVVSMCLGQGRQIPFGPFLAVGMLVVMFAGPWLLELWLGLARAH